MKSSRSAMIVITGVLTTALISILAAQQTTQPSGNRAGVRIGVYDSRAVSVAAVRSGVASQQVQQLQAQLKETEAAGNTQRAEQLKKRGGQLQTLRHLQAFSIAPVDDLLEPVKDKLPGIAQQAGVVLIVQRTDFASASIETVDLTDTIVKLFNPDARTAQIVANLKKSKPISLLEALAIEN